MEVSSRGSTAVERERERGKEVGGGVKDLPYAMPGPMHEGLGLSVSSASSSGAARAHALTMP